jgi:hypothetical protein
MADANDIADQQDLLATHRRTLAVLLRQRATFGAAYTPPAVEAGIAEARAAIADAKRALRGWGVAVDDLPDDAASFAPGAASSAGAAMPHAAGDVITANIGAGARGVAVGKDIQQTIAGDTSAGPADDRRAIEALVAGLERELAANAARLDAAVAAVAPIQLRLLAGELSKTGPRETPSASTVTLVGDWLLDNVAPLHDALVALFAAPPVLRALGHADRPLGDWLARRFSS